MHDTDLCRRLLFLMPLLLLQDNTISSVSILSSGGNYVAGDILVRDELGSGSGFVAQFSVNNVTGAVERYIFSISCLLFLCMLSKSMVTAARSVEIANHGQGDARTFCVHALSHLIFSSSFQAIQPICKLLCVTRQVQDSKQVVPQFLLLLR
jgi:hypothetical protein